jgi:phosphatidylserine/phosphatidylglycerophosphate/cardiolipin synthase-like enzyme/LAS superfamily LD-carboxypeptidase LdcB
MIEGNSQEWEEYGARLLDAPPVAPGVSSSQESESEFPEASGESQGAHAGPFLLSSAEEITSETESAFEYPEISELQENLEASSPEFEAQEQSESLSEVDCHGRTVAQENISAAHSLELDPYANIRSGMAPEHAGLEANELTVILGGRPAIVALHQMVGSPEMRQATLASLLGKSARKTVRHSGADVSIPAYLRLVSHLCRQAAEQSETESRDETVLSEDHSHASESWLNSSAETSESERSCDSEYEGPQTFELPQQDEEFRTDRFPQKLRDLFSKTDSAAWRPMLTQAITSGFKNPRELADLIFFMQHRERLANGLGKLIDKNEPDYIKLHAEWNLYETFAMTRLTPSFVPSVFLPANPSSDYLEYVNPPASGRITLMLNGRTSGKPWTEAFDAMQKTVESLGTNDSVFLAAFMLNPTLLTLPRTDMKTWGDLFVSKAQQGVKIRILLTGIPDPGPGWKSDLGNLDSLIGRLSSDARDNLKYIVSMHPARLNLDVQLGLDLKTKSLFLKSVKSVQTGGKSYDVATHHQKFMVVKKSGTTIAYCGGLDISPQRTPQGWSTNFIWHDTHAMLEGRIARDLEREFVLRWNREKDKPKASSQPAGKLMEPLTLAAFDKKDEAADKNTHKLQVLRTVSVGATPADIRRDDVWQAYFKLIASAKNFLFIENQYFHEPALAKAILKQTENESGLIVMIVISKVTDDPDDPFTRHGKAQQNESFTILSGITPKERLRVYSLDGRLVHSKVIMADDRALCMGSTNADPRDFFMDTQLNVLLDDPGAVSQFRHKLWAHDLGLSAETVKQWKVSEFFAQWDKVAKQNENPATTPDKMPGEDVISFDPTKVFGKRSPIADVLTEVSSESMEAEQPSAGEQSSFESESSFEQFFESEIDGSNLKWSGATQDQLDFMRAVYARHVANSQARRTFIADVPADNLSAVENQQRLRTEAASNCVTLLADARAALAAAQNSGDTSALEINRVNVVSGYRSASQQFTIWQNNFPKYYSQTAAHRSSLSGGAHGMEAISYQTSYIGNRVAAPGFSNHNDGRAVDLGADLTRSRRLTAGSSAASISLWRSSWLFQWLSNNAANYGFFQNTAINEPWHWEYRGTSEISPAQEADVTVVSSGNIYNSNTTLLKTHRGMQPDLYVCWNYASAIPSSVDVIVHLHGHSSDRGKMLLKNKVAASGLDFSDPAGVGGGRTGPSVGIIPRGDYAPRAATRVRAANPDVYAFPALVGPTAMNDLIAFGLGRFASAVGASGSVPRNRLILTCHSGGGDWLGSILPNIDPDEIHLFDAMYSTPPALLAWIDRHVASDDAGKPGTSAFRMFYTSKEFTTPNDNAIAIAARIRTALQKATNTQALARYFKVEWTTVGHPDIPRTYGWQLLADASAKVSQTRQLSPP